MKIGFIGDSITKSEYLNKKFKNFGSIVCERFGAVPVFVARGGSGLSSFLPVKDQPGSPDFDGQWQRLESGWSFAQAGEWRPVAKPILRVGDLSADFLRLLASDCHLVLITHTGTNDWQAVNELGASNGSYGPQHCYDQLREMVKRLVQAGKQVMLFTDATAVDERFHGVERTYMLDRLSYQRDAAIRVAAEFGLLHHSLWSAFMASAAAGKADWLMRNATCKPLHWSNMRWRLYQLTQRDWRGTKAARKTPSVEDRWHRHDPTRKAYWWNQHPNAFGHELIAEEMMKVLYEVTQGSMAA